MWRCDERLKAPQSDVCNKVCNRQETFRQHLAARHNLQDAKEVEDKLAKCHIQLGETQFWCGFCRDIIKLDTRGMSAQDICNGRFNHIDDHYSGRNGMVRKDVSAWVSADPEVVDAGGGKIAASRGKGKEHEAAGAEAEASRKRSSDTSTVPATKRARTRVPREKVVGMWYCVSAPHLILPSGTRCCARFY
jgi:hypothetical protein